jgi:hypothetical protein
MEQFIYELQTLEKYMKSHHVTYINNYKDKNKFKEAFIHHKVNKILTYASTYLINSSGCDWNNIKILEDKGYYVGPGEQDRFGWLTGIIGTSKGDILYG